MLKSIEGIYRDGKVQLLEPAPDVNNSRVIVTFLPSPGPIDLAARGVDERQTAELRWRLETFAEDWNSPEMDVYDDL
jgi:hypothetical protein